MAKQSHVWVIDDDRSIRWVLEKALERGGISVRTFASADGARDLLERERPDVIVTDIRMPGGASGRLGTGTRGDLRAQCAQRAGQTGE